MAARGGPKYKEYRVPITSVRHWLKEIEYDGLIVCEIYGTAFGACQVILPTINTIMLSIDDSEEKVKWITINVAKLEEDQRQLLSEEEKKKREAESQMRRRSSTMVSTEDGKEETPNTAREHTSDHLLSLVEEDELKSKSGWDKVTIPKLEKYSGYDHPRPLWLMIKDGQVTHELTTANPPKMQRLVTSIVNGIPLTEQELWAMDMHPETDPAKKKKRKVPEKKKEKKKKVKVQKVETVIPPEFILSCRITDLKKSDWDSKRAPLIALYTKDGSAIDFSYHSQTERVRDDHDPIFYKNFSFLKSDDLDQELKFVIYDAESDDIKREHPPVLGEAYAHLKTLLGQEEGTQDLKLVTEDGTEIEKSILSVSIKTRAQPGIVTDWKFTVSCSKLPGLEGNPNKIDPVVQLSVQDVNTQRFGYVSETERLRSTPDPTFSTRLTIAHHSRDDRLLRFTVYDVDEYDILNEKKGMIGVATIRFETFLAQRKLTKDKTVTLPLVDVDSKQVGDAIITLAAEEIGGTGEDDEDELETNTSGQIGNEEKKEATNVVEKVEVAFAIREFIPRDGGNDPLIAIYRKASNAPDAPYEYMGQTERVKSDTNPKFDKVFLLDRPSTASNVSHEYRFVVYDADNDVDLSSAIVMAETALDFAGTNVDAGLIELGVINAQGQPIERTVFTLTMKPVGSITSTPFAIMCGDLPSSARGKCDSMVMLYSKNLTNGKYSFVGSTESVPNSTDPIFTKNLIIDRYSAVNRELRACVWDVESDGETVVEKEMLGECFFRVEDIVKQAEVMTQVELKLTKNDRPSNDGKSFLRLQPLIKPVARPGSAGVVAPEEEKETSVELTQEEKEAGTSPATADGSKVAVHVAVKDINKRDWVGPLAPLIAVYKKNPATGKFDFIDQTERVKDESSISFSRTFLLDNPTGSQFYRLALMDATANDANVTLKGRYSRDTQMLGELVIDLRDLISTGTMDYRMVDRENKEVEKTRVAVSVKLVGVVTTTSVNVAAVDLPRSELFAKCDPMAVLFAKNIITGIWQELQRTERQTNHFSPSFKSPFTLTSYSRMDTTLRVSLYDVDYPDLPLSDKDLLGEMEFSCDTYLAGPRVGTYQLLKNGVHVNDGKAMLHLTNTAKPEPTPVEEKKEVVSEKPSSKPVSKPASAARQRPTPAADKLAEIEAKEPIVADPVVVDDEDEKKVEPVTSTPAVIPAPAAVESKEEKDDDKKEDETTKQDDSKEEDEEEAKEKEVEKTTTSGPEPTPVSDAEAAAAVERVPAE